MTLITKTLLCGLASLTAAYSQAVITTVAGGLGKAAYGGDGGLAINAALRAPTDMAADSAGNLYIADYTNNVVRKVDTHGIITTFAGNGTLGNSGDGGPAVNAEFFYPVAIAVDGPGNVYIADAGNGSIRKVDTSGTISTYAAPFGDPAGLAIDSAGNLYVSGRDCFVHKVTPGGTVSTIAGTGGAGFAGDGGPATKATLYFPNGVAVDASGNVYIADTANNRVRKVDTHGVITTIAGSGSAGFSGDGGPAISAKLGLNYTNAHQGIAVDSTGNVYLADSINNRIRMINTAGIISTYAGNGTPGVLGVGDGGAPNGASLSGPWGVSIDAAGNIFIADTAHSLIREVAGGAKASGGGAVPVISANGIQNGASFQPGIAANSWTTILGADLAPKTDNWNSSIVNGQLPTSLDGVKVTMGGKPAYIYYISSTQLNVLAPDLSPGPVTVTVTTPSGTSAAVTVNAATYGPAFFLWPGNQPVATRTDYSLVDKAGTFSKSGDPSAKPGDTIILWATGFGPTTPSTPPGQVVPGDQAYSTMTLPTVLIDNVSALVYGAALAPGSAGLYQIAIQVPASLGAGDWPILATVGGVTSPSGVLLTVSH
ncbi:MAG TPA: IPT/TIG domain-containing protein [Candidatus Sulfopaludibacter sp.]|jgi:uncharacterized protein (TIGR03437 family)|nr:IPT/TIG domain-containing protein [Candidatus Sulfopaludibacter sp.]